jgi:hypothetical protein
MARFDIRVTSRPHIEAPEFSADQMHAIADYGIEVMKDRLHRGVNVFDQPAKPLGEKYARRKSRLGKQPVRDMLLTGNTVGSIQTLEFSANHAKISIKGSTPYQKALFNQNIDPEFGLSDNDEVRLLTEKIQPAFAANISELNGIG